MEKIFFQERNTSYKQKEPNVSYRTEKYNNGGKPYRMGFIEE